MNHKLDPIGHKTRHEEYASLHPTSAFSVSEGVT
ncbi:hypothetical protein L915_12896 [Phytophthora nicotianae]|uniref:Uncharacterized protein n=1 Tax=Phytophthora nicotianae TaxID=4792 RepID=W2GF50_PHYNI|nr:hypothetical protein L915_12896 [Phytophthora nicotianae]